MHVAVLRSVVAPVKGKFEGTAGRGPFNDIMEQVAVPERVTFEAAILGGTAGWWAKPAKARKGTAIIHVHGGWFNWGDRPGIPALRRPHCFERRRRCFHT